MKLLSKSEFVSTEKFTALSVFGAVHRLVHRFQIIRNSSWLHKDIPTLNPDVLYILNITS